MTIKIIRNEKGSPAGKLADVELHFDAEDGVLDGLKLIGFGIWERRAGGRNVTFPARQYAQRRTQELRTVAAVGRYGRSESHYRPTSLDLCGD